MSSPRFSGFLWICFQTPEPVTANRPEEHRVLWFSKRGPPREAIGVRVCKGIAITTDVPSTLEAVVGAVERGSGTWRSKKLPLFAARAGVKFDRELMVIGRAVNGGHPEWSANTAPFSAASIVDGALAETLSADPMVWVTPR